MNQVEKPVSNVWVVLSLIFLLPLGLILMWAKTNWATKTKWVVSIVLGGPALLFTLSSIGSSKSEVQSTTQTVAVAPTKMPQPTAHPTLIPTPKATGLGITRQAVIDALDKGAEAGGDSDFQFKPGVAIKGQDNYIASQGQNLVQLIGPANNLTEVGSTAFIGDSTKDNMFALIYIVGLGNIVDPNSQEWITNVMKDAGNTDQDNKKWTKVIDNKKYEIDMQTIGTVKTFTLTIDPS